MRFAGPDIEPYGLRSPDRTSARMIGISGLAFRTAVILGPTSGGATAVEQFQERIRQVQHRSSLTGYWRKEDLE